MSQVNNAKKVEVEKSAIVVSRLMVSDYQKEKTKTAELKQTVKIVSYYPSKSVSHSLQDNPFSSEDFGFEDKEFVQQRIDVAWLNVPEASTTEQVLEKIKSGTLYRVMSNKPIISDSQQYAIDNAVGDVTADVFANRQVLRYGSDTEDGLHKAGDLILDNLGRPLYKASFFSMDSEKSDENRSSQDPADFYASPEIAAELAGTVAVIAGQSL